MSSFFSSLNVSATGLTAQRMRLDVISQNLANVNTTRTEDGTPYKKRIVVFEERNAAPFSKVFGNELSKLNTHSGGVQVKEIVKDRSTGVLTYDPDHPDANEEGYVEGSNVNTVEEMVNMIAASRAYEANITAFNTTKSMISKTMEITK